MTVTPSFDSSGTTWTRSVSRTAHVRVTVKVSPIRTAPLLDRVQQRIGSISTFPPLPPDGGGDAADAEGGAGTQCRGRVRGVVDRLCQLREIDATHR